MAGSDRKAGKKRRQSNWPLRFILLAVFLSYVLVAIVVPVVRAQSVMAGKRLDVTVEWILLNSMAWFLGAWFFYVGCCLGSFLNVVAYRLPNGLTLLGSSRCSYCLVNISSRHNLPIFGWFTIRGRCQTCRLPISCRYLIVELLAGLLLLLLFFLELVQDGSHLPTDHRYRIHDLFRTAATGHPNQLLQMDWSLLRIFFVHSLLGYALFTGGLMRMDGFQLPSGWKAFHWLAIFIMIAIWPLDFEFARSPFQAVHQVPPIVQRFDFQLFGWLVGTLIGLQFSNLFRVRGSGVVFSMGLLGVGFGLSATISIGILFWCLVVIGLLTGLKRIVIGHTLFVLLVAFLLQLGCWDVLSSLPFWPHASASPLTLVGFLAPGSVAVILAIFYRKQVQKGSPDAEA